MKITKSKLKHLIKEVLESLNEGNIPDEQAEAILRRAAAGKGGYPASQRVIKIYRSLSPEDKTKFNKISQDYTNKAFKKRNMPTWAIGILQGHIASALIRSGGDMDEFEIMLNKSRLEEGELDENALKRLGKYVKQTFDPARNSRNRPKPGKKRKEFDMYGYPKDTRYHGSQRAITAVPGNKKLEEANKPKLPKNWRELPRNHPDRVAYRKWYRSQQKNKKKSQGSFTADAAKKAKTLSAKPKASLEQLKQSLEKAKAGPQNDITKRRIERIKRMISKRTQVASMNESLRDINESLKTVND